MHHNIYANLRLIPGNSRLKIYLPPLFMAIYIAQLQNSSLLVGFIVQILISSRRRHLNV